MDANNLELLVDYVDVPRESRVEEFSMVDEMVLSELEDGPTKAAVVRLQREYAEKIRDLENALKEEKDEHARTKAFYNKHIESLKADLVLKIEAIKESVTLA